MSVGLGSFSPLALFIYRSQFFKQSVKVLYMLLTHRFCSVWIVALPHIVTLLYNLKFIVIRCILLRIFMHHQAPAMSPRVQSGR